jgi:hypothetical protein
MVVTNVVSLNPTHGKVYSIQDYVMKFISNLRQVGSLGKLKYVVLVGDENFYLPYFTKIQPINDYGSGDNSTDMIIYSAERLSTMNHNLSRLLWPRFSSD